VAVPVDEQGGRGLAGLDESAVEAWH